MRTAPSFCVLITAAVVNVSCRGVLGPSCTDESGGVLRTEGVVQMDGTSSHTVVSPKSSNLPPLSPRPVAFTGGRTESQ